VDGGERVSPRRLALEGGGRFCPRGSPRVVCARDAWEGLELNSRLLPRDVDVVFRVPRGDGPEPQSAAERCDEPRRPAVRTALPKPTTEGIALAGRQPHAHAPGMARAGALSLSRSSTRCAWYYADAAATWEKHRRLDSQRSPSITRRGLTRLPRKGA
jgi:hypothetical protein